MQSIVLITLFLLTIIGANSTIAVLGPEYIGIVSFLVIPIDFIVRDHLHEKWQGRELWKKMFLLIFFGSFLSLICNLNSWKIAVASFFGFLLSSLMDAIVYNWLKNSSILIKGNFSNFAFALVDSIVFPLLAFGLINTQIFINQFLFKFLGGILFTLILVILKKS